MKQNLRLEPSSIGQYQPYPLSRNWATVGFFDVSPSLETITVVTEIDENGNEINPFLEPTSQTQFGETSRNLSRQPSLGRQISIGPGSDISIGDVYEVVPVGFKTSQVVEFVKVVEIHYASKSVTLEGHYGPIKRTFHELQDESKYIKLISEAPDLKNRKNNYIIQKSLRDPLLREKAKYSGAEGKRGIYALFHQAQDERCLSTNLQTDGPASPITPRLAYIRACRRDKLPPIPLLARCYDESYPVLDLSGQSLGNRFSEALAESLPNMTFLREINLSGNRLNGKSAAIILNSMMSSNIESIVLNDNRIGKEGCIALTKLIAAQSNPNVTTLKRSLDKSVSNAALNQSVSKRRNSNLQGVSLPKPPGVLSLVKLSINDNNLGDILVAKIIIALTICCGSIKHLELRGNNCSTGTATAIADILQSKAHPNLSYIDLAWNSLQCSGGQKVLASAATNIALAVLILDWNGLGVNIVDALNNLVNKNSTLQLLSITNNNIPEREIQSILESRTNLKIQYKDTV